MPSPFPLWIVQTSCFLLSNLLFVFLSGNGIVRGLSIYVVNRPPTQDIVAVKNIQKNHKTASRKMQIVIHMIVCGINFPNTTVAPMNGAVNSQIRAQTIVEYPHNLFFSGVTSSVVQVVSIESVQEMPIFTAIAADMRRITRSIPITNIDVSINIEHKKIFKGIIYQILVLNLQTIQSMQPQY
jgi:hypothetical protein